MVCHSRKEYFKEVKGIILNNMDLCGSLSKLSVLNFHTKYRKELLELEGNVECVCTGLTEKRKKDIYVTKSVVKRIDILWQ